MSDLDSYIAAKFAVDSPTFLKALRLSPNAEGYLVGAITELVLRDTLIAQGFDVKRVREKWEGEKHPNHRGDFYVRRHGSSDWYVLESKGVKSNSEKWHTLFNRTKLVSFLESHRHLTPFSSDAEIRAYVTKALPKFASEYLEPLYSHPEVEKYKRPRRATAKSRRISELQGWSREELAHSIAERVSYVRKRINVVETHFVSGGSKVGKRTQATPRADEFHLIAMNLILRTGKHDIVFVDPKKLLRSSTDTDHLQQNYVVDILFDELKPEPNPAPPWSRDIDAVFATLTSPVREEDMQIDDRSDEEIATEIDEVGTDPI